MVDTINMIENTFLKLQKIPGGKREIVKTKIFQLQQKNQGYTILKSFGKVLCGNNDVQLPENYSPSLVADM